MVERAESIGGQVQVRSTPGQGTRVRVVVPLSGTQPEARSDAMSDAMSDTGSDTVSDTGSEA